MKFKLLFLLSLFFSSISFSQKFIEPIIGLAANRKTTNGIDANIKQFVIGLQVCTVKKKKFEYGFRLEAGLPQAFKSFDSSFTLNPNLSLYKSAGKTVRKTSLSFILFQHFKLFSITKKDKFSLLFNSGVSFQKTSFRYDYDKINYVILNPDKTFEQVGLQLGIGFQYLYSLKNGRIFLQGLLNFPIISKKYSYPTIYKGLVSQSINVGYSVPLKNN